MIKKPLAAILVCLLFGSCLTLKTPKRAGLVPLEASQEIGHYPVRINKTYMREGKKVVVPIMIWRYFGNSEGIDSLTLSKATHISLRLTDEHHLEAALFRDSIALKTNVLRGRLRKGYFRKRGQIWLTGVPPFYWSLTSVKMQLGIGQERQLFIDHADETDGGILIMLAGTPGLTSHDTIPLYVK